MLNITDEVAIAMKEAGLIKKVIGDGGLSDEERAVLYWEQLVANVNEEVRRDNRKVRRAVKAAKVSKAAKADKADVKERAVGT